MPERLRKKFSFFTYILLIFSGFIILLIMFLFFLRWGFFKRLEISVFQNNIYEIRLSISNLINEQEIIFFGKDTYLKENNDFRNFLSDIENTKIKFDKIKKSPLVASLELENDIGMLEEIFKSYNVVLEMLQKNNEELYIPINGIINQKNEITKNIEANVLYKKYNLFPYFKKLKSIENELFISTDLDTFFAKTDKILGIVKNLSDNIADDSKKIVYIKFYDLLTKYTALTVREFEKKMSIGLTYETGEFNLMALYLLKAEKLLSNINEKITDKSNLIKNRYISTIYASILVLILIFLGAAYWFFLIIRKPWEDIRQQLENLKQGQLNSPAIVEDVFEYFFISESLNEIVSALKSKNQEIQHLTKGQYEIEIKLKSENDEIGKSLISLKEKLIKDKEETQKILNSQYLNQWINEGIAKIGAIMRQNTDDLEKFAHEVLLGLMDYTNALQGIFFVTVNPENREPYLEMIKAFAYGKERTNKKIVKMYEGLIGTAAAEQRFYFFEKVPENYVFLEDAFGRSKPESLIIMPLVVEGNLLGIIEMAFSEKLQKHVVDFFKRISTEIAITLSYVKINQKTKELFEHTRKQAEELAHKEEQYKKNQQQLKQIIWEFEERLRLKDKEIKNLEDIVDDKIAENKKLKEQLSDKFKDYEKTLDKFTAEKEKLLEEIKKLKEQLNKNDEK